MGKRTVKPFDPKPLTTGAKIGWIQHHMDGTTTERTGIVIDRAPAVNGAVVVCWVKPDKPLDTDLHSMLAVGKATTSYSPVHGRDVSRSMAPKFGAHTTKGDLFASDDPVSATGALAALSVRGAGARLYLVTGKAGDWRSGTREVTCALYAADESDARERAPGAMNALTGYVNASVRTVRAA